MTRLILKLDETHLEIHQHLMKGGFVVQSSATKSFTQVPIDLSIEQTVNKGTKTKGGIIGFSLRRAAVLRWMITAHERASITENCKGMAGFHDADHLTHKETGKSRMEKDTGDVKRVATAMKQLINPFQPSEELFSLTSGMTANQEVTTDLLQAYEKGSNAMQEFFQERLLSNEVSFYDTLSRLNLKTFTTMQKSKKVKVSGREVNLKADRNLFAKMIVIAQTCHISLKEVLKHCLGPIPWSLAHSDGTLAKTSKSKLQELLEKETD